MRRETVGGAGKDGRREGGRKEVKREGVSEGDTERGGRGEQVTASNAVGECSCSLLIQILPNERTIRVCVLARAQTHVCEIER